MSARPLVRFVYFGYIRDHYDNPSHPIPSRLVSTST